MLSSKIIFIIYTLPIFQPTSFVLYHNLIKSIQRWLIFGFIKGVYMKIVLTSSKYILVVVYYPLILIPEFLTKHLKFFSIDDKY
ncbi:hypothetical protein EOZ68_24095, partial [Salmonella enterica]|nr:hypothetical protein [Salmonella enterica]